MNRTTVSKYSIPAMLLSLMMTGCVSQPTIDERVGSNEPVQHSPGEVYLIRGLFNVFSLGMDDIGKSLEEKGVKAGVHSGPSWPNLAEQIREKHNQGDQERPLVISGHSYGADDSIRLARALDEEK